MNYSLAVRCAGYVCLMGVALTVTGCMQAEGNVNAVGQNSAAIRTTDDGRLSVNADEIDHVGANDEDRRRHPTHGIDDENRIATRTGFAQFAPVKLGGNLSHIERDGERIDFDASIPAWRLRFNNRKGGRVAVVIPSSKSSDISRRVQRDDINQRDVLTTTYRGIAEFADEAIGFVVTTTWRSGAKNEDIRGQVAVSMPGLNDTNYYLSRVHFPVVAARPITEIGDPNAGRDVWVAGNGGGYKYIDPIGKQLSAKNLPEPFFLTFPAMGFYNDAVDDGKLLYISHTGSKGFAKYITFAGEEAQNRVRYEIQQVPADMHHIDTYSMPYEVVLAHLRGDWWDVADTYRTFLRKDVDWYHGPVGHPDSGRSAAARDTLFTTTIHQVGIVRGSRKKGFFQANNQTLDFDIDVRKHLGAEIQRYADVFGGRGTHIVYGATEFAEHPEYSRFDQWYQRPLTYLPGLYNLIDFANESVAYLGGQNVAPYVQGSVAWAEDSQVPAGPSNSFTQMMLASAVRNEVGEPVKAHWGTPTNPATSNFMCPGEGKWHFNLPFEAAMIKEHTTTSDEPGLKHRYAAFITEYLQVDGPVRAERDFSLFGEDPRTVPGHGFNSFYLDYFMGFTECFDPSHGHPIGGGSWFTQAKMDQMKFLKALYRDDPVYLPTEGLNGVFTQVMDQMHYDIYGAPYGADREHVESIPFFRSVFDNINIGELRVEGTPPQAAVGNSAYRQTLRVFQYGQLFSWGSYVLERPWMWNDPEQTQHEDYFRSLAGIFRDGGLLKFHKGTLVRRPAMRTSLDPDFTAFPFGINDAGNAHILATDFNAVTPEDVSIFPMGMYRHPNGSYAIAVTNPWLEGAPSPFVVAERVEGAYEISIDLSKYKGLKDGAFVVVRLGSVPEGEILAEDSDTSGLRLNGTLAPGETHVYTLRPLR